MPRQALPIPSRGRAPATLQNSGGLRRRRGRGPRRTGGTMRCTRDSVGARSSARSTVAPWPSPPRPTPRARHRQWGARRNTDAFLCTIVYMATLSTKIAGPMSGRSNPDTQQSRREHCARSLGSSNSSWSAAAGMRAACCHERQPEELARWRLPYAQITRLTGGRGVQSATTVQSSQPIRHTAMTRSRAGCRLLWCCSAPCALMRC